MRGDIQANFYRLAHHGAYQSGSSSKTKANKNHFPEAVSPIYVFSSSAAPPNSYNHPRCGLCECLKSIVRRPIKPTGALHIWPCKDISGKRRNYGDYSTSPSMPMIIRIATDGRTSRIKPVPYHSTI